jgi:hypothetical protein
MALATVLHVAQQPGHAGCIASPAGLVSWWKAEGKVNDQTTTNDGSLSGAAYETGKVGQAFFFKGTNQFQAPTTALPTGNANRSIALWVNVTEFQTTGNSYFAGYGKYGYAGQMYVLGALGDSDRRLFFTNWGEGLIGPTLLKDRWYHVAVTNIGNSATLYLDGQPVGTQSLGLATTSHSFLAGLGAVDSKHNGYLDEIQVFNRALSAAEILSIYTTGSSGLCYSLAALTPGTLPNGTAGTAYNQTLTASNGTAPYAYTVTSGAVPTGLTLASNGTLSGIPAAPGAFGFTVTATDSISGSVTGSYSITIPVKAPAVTPLADITTEIRTPVRLAADSSGNIYVADPKAGGVLKYDSAGTFVRKFTTQKIATGVAIAKNGDLLVSQGTFVAVFDKTTGIEQPGFGTGLFTYANAITVDPAGYIYVSDGRSNNIRKFGVTHNLLNTSPGTVILKNPSGLRYETLSNQLAVANTMGGNIVFLSADLQTQNSTSTISSLTYPLGIDFEYDASGALSRIYVSDSFQSYVKVFDGTRVFLAYIAGYGFAAEKLFTPRDVLFDQFNPLSKRLFVANGSGNVAVFGISN